MPLPEPLTTGIGRGPLRIPLSCTDVHIRQWEDQRGQGLRHKNSVSWQSQLQEEIRAFSFSLSLSSGYGGLCDLTGAWDETLKLFDEGDGCAVDGWANACRDGQGAGNEEDNALEGHVDHCDGSFLGEMKLLLVYGMGEE